MCDGVMFWASNANTKIEDPFQVDDVKLYWMDFIGWLEVGSFIEIINQHYKEDNGLGVRWSNVLG